MIWIQSLRLRLRLRLRLGLGLGLSPLCRFISAWAFEAQGQTLLAIEPVNTFMIIPPAFPPEHDVNPAVAIVDPGLGDLPDT